MHLFPTVVMGDLHGNHEVLLRALVDLGLADVDGHWTGGRRRLVQVGDTIDRGPGPLDTLDLLMRLQAEARAAGGEVVCLLGNHELMAMRAAAGDHEARIQWAYNGAGANLVQWGARRGEAVDLSALPYPEAFFAEFAADGVYGRWLSSLPVACRVGDYIAVHAGWTPECPASLVEALSAPAAAVYQMLWARNQPEGDIEAVCTRLGCRGLITGHTVQQGIRTSSGGRLIQIDVGMFYFRTWAAVGLDEAGRPWALVENCDPVRIDGDGLLPVARKVEESRPAGEPRYGAGDLVRVYAAADGSYRRYFLVEGRGEPFHGYPTYAGRNLVYSEGQWSSRPATSICDRTDRFGRPAVRSEVPTDLIE